MGLNQTCLFAGEAGLAYREMRGRRENLKIAGLFATGASKTYVCVINLFLDSSLGGEGGAYRETADTEKKSMIFLIIRRQGQRKHAHEQEILPFSDHLRICQYITLSPHMNEPVCVAPLFASNQEIIAFANYRISRYATPSPPANKHLFVAPGRE